jgi:protoheme IX farnesyltransferase
MINYYLLTKPGIIVGNLFTLAAGFILASKGHVDYVLFLKTLIGLAFVMASGCVFNNYIDRHLDKKMRRTNNRPLVQGVVTENQALIFASVLGILGALILLFYTNLITFVVAAVGFFVYVVLYSLWKSRTIYGTAIGSIAGAIPPVVGYTAAGNHLDIGAFILFSMMVLWQMPHFFSIALSHLDDYIAADIPVLPAKCGVLKTKYHMMIYIIGFILSTSLLTFFNYTGYLFFGVALCMGSAWLFMSLRGFKCSDDQIWGHRMFSLSLWTIGAICLTIPFDLV